MVSNEKVYYIGKDDYNRDCLKVWWNTFAKLHGNLITLKEAEEHKNLKISDEDLNDLSLSNAKEKIKKIKFISRDARIEPSIDLEDVVYYAEAMHCSHGIYYTYSKYCSYCCFPRKSEYAYGSWTLLNSKFCINCYESSKLTRCFEVAESTNCQDCYFCYNSENLDNCMFCSNATSKRYAIGNVEIGKEKYTELKNKILESINEELEKKKDLKWDIYNIGCYDG